MRKTVQGGNTVIISGPASATVLEGTVAVLGGELTVEEKIVVRRGKALPLEAEEASILDIVLGADANIYEMEGSTIPDSWRTVTEDALSRPKPCTVIVLGDIDSGKTSFSTYLINKSLKSRDKSAIVDADLGQSDVGPPTSIGLSVVSEPVADLFSVKPFAIIFTGRTSANGITQRVVSGIMSILKQIPEGPVDLTVLNTDGWIEGDDAHAYKAELIRQVDPNLVVGIQRNAELDTLLHNVEEEGFHVLRVDTSSAVKRRDRDERRELREQSYKKYLGKPTVRNLHLNWIALEYTPLGLGTPVDLQRVEALEKALQRRIMYCEENSRMLCMVVNAWERVDEAIVVMAESLFHKDVYLVKEGEEEGLLVGLLNNDRDFLGLGIISKLDYINRTLKIQTAYKDTVNIVQFGQVKINEAGKEVGVTTAFSTKDHA
jgi:polynucleotide 5'-hydroxyl-kinase GRC3/NOL9